MATHSGMLAWRIPWTDESGGLWSRVGHDWSDLARTPAQMERALSDMVSSVISALCTFGLPSSHGWIPKLSPRVQAGEQAEPLYRLQWIWELPSLMTALFGLGKTVFVFVFRNGLIFFSWNLHQWWYMLVCPLLRSRIKSYPNGDIDAPKGIQVCWDHWTRNREGQTWLHVESTLLALTLVL